MTRGKEEGERDYRETRGVGSGHHITAVGVPGKEGGRESYMGMNLRNE